jgi:anti-sigma factor RsiW
MKCEDLLKALNAYVDGEIDPEICREFEEHLEGCNPCQVVVDNIRKTITLYQCGRPVEMPSSLREKLHHNLREKWNRTKEHNP